MLMGGSTCSRLGSSMVQPTSRKSFPVSWDQFHRDARPLAWRLADKGPFDAIVCITHRGLVPAAIVARQLDPRVLQAGCVAIYAHGHRGQLKPLKPLPRTVSAMR